MQRLDLFMERLKSALAKLPKETADDVIAYYSEYIEDARSAGLDEDAILAKVGSVEHIVSALEDDLVIARAQKKPGPVNLVRSSRRMLGRGVARAAKSTSLALLSIWPLLAALVFYAASVVSGLAAPAGIGFVVYSMVTHPGLTGTDILAQVGLMLLLFSVCGGIAWGLWKAANGLTRVTLGIFRRIAVKARTVAVATATAATAIAAQAPVMELRPLKKKRHWGELISGIVLIVLLATGLNLSFLNDLVPRYWALWNTQKPADIENIHRELPIGNVQKLKIDVLNTRVEVVRGTGDSIRIDYERAQYYAFEAVTDAGILELVETGNGKLPFIDLLAKHEGTTTLVVTVPQGSAGMALEIHTNGGHVEIDAPFSNYHVDTNDGNITLHSEGGKYAGTLHSNGGHVTVVK